MNFKLKLSFFFFTIIPFLTKAQSTESGLKFGFEKILIDVDGTYYDYSNSFGANIGYQWYHPVKNKLFLNYGISLSIQQAQESIKIKDVAVQNNGYTTTLGNSIDAGLGYLLTNKFGVICGYNYLYNYNQLAQTNSNHSISLGIDYKLKKNRLTLRYLLPLNNNKYNSQDYTDWDVKKGEKVERISIHRVELSYSIMF